METPEPIAKERPHVPEPTAHDIEIARVRQEIAARMEEKYMQCLMWSLHCLGDGWLPSGYHYLVTKEEEERMRREGGNTVAAATVYTVKNKHGEKKHFVVSGQGVATEVADYKQGFGDMLFEPSEKHGFEKDGKWHAHQKYSLCWGPFELYEPKTAEQLAFLRATRERKKAEREEQTLAEDFPLFYQAGLRPEDLHVRALFRKNRSK